MMSESGSSDHRGREHRRVLGGRWLFLALLLLLGGLVFAGDLDQCNCQLHPESCGGGGNGTPGDGAVSSCTGAVIGCYYGPPPTGSTPTPAAVGGFSTGGWYGTGGIAAGYDFGVIDATVGSMGALCPWDYPPDEVAAHEESPAEVPGLRALWNSGRTADVFFFLTGLYHVTDQCTTHAPPELTAWQWGVIQADYFVQFVHDACQENPCQPIDRYFGDVERVIDGDTGYDYAGWEYSSDNALVVAAFENTLTGYCGVNGIPQYLCAYPNGFANGLYSNVGEMSAIPEIGPGYDLQTSTIWEAGYVYNDTPEYVINADEDFFTAVGWHVYSWQYANDDCNITYASAGAKAKAASPPIPRFDRWTRDGSGVSSPC